MSVTLTILGDDTCYFTPLAENTPVSIGADPNCSLRIPELNPALEVIWNGEVGEIRRKKTGELQKVALNKLAFFSKTPERSTAQDFIAIFSRSHQEVTTVDIPQNKKICIGRKVVGKESTNDIDIDLPYISRKHMILTCKNGSVVAEDTQSTNGVYLNGKRIERATLHDGDVLTICTVRVLYKNRKLHFENVGSELTINSQKKAAKKNPIYPDSFTHGRSPRFVNHVPPVIIQLEKPPAAGSKPQISWFSVLATPLISVALMLVLVFVMGMSPVMLIMSGVMSILSAIMAVRNYHKQTKSYKETISKRETIYSNYLEKVEKELNQVRTQYQEALSTANPNARECCEILTARDRRLWERTPEDEDFLAVRLGEGRIASIATAQYAKTQLAMDEDALENKAVALSQKYLWLDEVPILCNLRESTLTGLVGSHKETTQLLRNVVAELCTAHSYDELKIVAVFPKDEREEWEWMRWLPHCANNEKTRRYLATEKDSDALLDELWEELQVRVQTQDNYGSTVKDKTPYYLFITSIPGQIGKHALGKLLFSHSDIGIGALILGNGILGLPKEVSQIIELHEGEGALFQKNSSKTRQEFCFDKTFSAKDADQFARTMSPIVTETSVQSELPNSISFLQGYGVKMPYELNIAKRWQSAKTYETLSVPIAGREGGGIFYFDVHERKHGVHGVVAGKTGSGKTEMVQSWVLSLAVNYSPQDVNFVLIDFKGTGLIAPFRKLPHVAGSISNLDKKSTVARNLVALRNEIHRREALLDKYSEEDSKSSIIRLNKAYDQGKIGEKLPVLIIAIDEYAEFKKVYPDFGAEIDSLVSVGRSLGIFLILMTQKPSGVISQQVEHNIMYRWCLRVANASASKEMLGTADAAKISRPGRAYIKIGEDDLYEQVQSFWCGAPFDPNKKNDIPTEPVISRVTISGTRIPCEIKENEEQTNHTEVEAVVEHICAHCRNNSIPGARQVWTSPLPDKVDLAEVIGPRFNGFVWPEKCEDGVVIGLKDVPEEQAQYPMMLNPSKEGHTVIYGGPMSGKTTFLKTFAMSLAMSQSPAEANIYVLEYGGCNLSVLEDLPHVGGVAHEKDPDRQEKLLLLLGDILQDRKMKFSAIKVGNIKDYRKETGKPMPKIYLLVDGIGTAKQVFSHSRRLQFAHSTMASVSLYGRKNRIYLLIKTASPFRLSITIHSISSSPFDKLLSCSILPKRTTSPISNLLLLMSAAASLSSVKLKRSTAKSASPPIMPQTSPVFFFGLIASSDFSCSTVLPRLNFPTVSAPACEVSALVLEEVPDFVFQPPLVPSSIVCSSCCTSEALAVRSHDDPSSLFNAFNISSAL